MIVAGVMSWVLTPLIFFGFFAGALAGPSAAAKRQAERARKRKMFSTEAKVAAAAATIFVAEELVDGGIDQPF